MDVPNGKRRGAKTNPSGSVSDWKSGTGMECFRFIYVEQLVEEVGTMHGSLWRQELVAVMSPSFNIRTRVKYSCYLEPNLHLC